MQGQRFLRSHSVPAAFPSDVALGGQCQAGVGFPLLLLPRDEARITQVKGTKV